MFINFSYRTKIMIIIYLNINLFSKKVHLQALEEKNVKNFY